MTQWRQISKRLHLPSNVGPVHPSKAVLCEIKLETEDKAVEIRRISLRSVEFVVWTTQVGVAFLEHSVGHRSR